MKATISTRDNSGVPNIVIKPENIAEEAVLNAILNRNGDEVRPDPDYCVIDYEHNGTSFQSMTIGLRAGATVGTVINAKVIEADGTDTYQDDALIGATVFMVFTGGSIRVPQDYTFAANTGTIVFQDAVAEEIIIQIIYK